MIWDFYSGLKLKNSIIRTRDTGCPDCLIQTTLQIKTWGAGWTAAYSKKYAIKSYVLKRNKPEMLSALKARAKSFTAFLKFSFWLLTSF